LGCDADPYAKAIPGGDLRHLLHRAFDLLGKLLWNQSRELPEEIILIEAIALHDLIKKWNQDPDRDQWTCPWSIEALTKVLQEAKQRGCRDGLEGAAKIASDYYEEPNRIRQTINLERPIGPVEAEFYRGLCEAASNIESRILALVKK